MASGHFVYVSCQKGRRVDVAHLDDATGDLAPVQSLALPGDGMALTLQQTMGIKRASYYAYTGQNINGRLALELGIVNEVLPREELLPRAWELAEMMMERPRSVRHLTHAILSRPWKRALVNDLGFYLTHQMFDMAIDTEGPLARLMKMKARFQGEG